MKGIKENKKSYLSIFINFTKDQKNHLMSKRIFDSNNDLKIFPSFKEC